MVDLGQLKMLAENGTSAAEAARMLGISRQRIHQIAQKAGLKFQRSYRRPPRSPRPRLLTGGILVKVSTRVAGKVADMLVAADLLARGWQVFLPIHDWRGGHDLIATRHDRLITVEVRSAYRSATGLVKYAPKDDSKSSHYGLVITGEPVIYKPPLDD